MVNIGKLKQILEMRKAAKKMQKSLGQELVVGEALKGQVKISMDGNQKIVEVHIDPVLLNSDNQLF